MGLFDVNTAGGLFGNGIVTGDNPMPELTQPKRGGFLGSGYDGEDIMSMLLRAAAIAQGDYGAGAEFGSNIGARARAAAAEAQKRQAELQDYEAKKRIDQEYAGPPNNDTINDYNFILQNLGEEAAKNYLRNLGDPMVTTTLPGDKFYSGRQSGLATALGGVGGGSTDTPPPQAVADLKANPASAAQFDEIFGAGSAAKYLGGGSSNAPGMFQNAPRKRP